MAKMNWEKVNRKKSESRQNERSSEHRKSIKGKGFNPDDFSYIGKKKKNKKKNSSKKSRKKESATKKQVDFIRNCKMIPEEMIDSLSKKGASKVITRFLEKKN